MWSLESIAKQHRDAAIRRKREGLSKQEADRLNREATAQAKLRASRKA